LNPVSSKHFVEGVLREHRESSIEELLELPKQQELNASPAERGVTYCRWVDSLGDGAIRVVVQTYRKSWLGIGKMSASGFEMTPDGSIRNIPEDDMYEYL